VAHYLSEQASNVEGAALKTGYAKRLPHGLMPDIGLPSGIQPSEALIQEVFSSFQGEGVWVGQRQLFIRLAHCHLKCAYCDTPMRTETGEAYVEVSPNQNIWTSLPNPFTAETLWPHLLPLLESFPHPSVSLTGGEPLLYPSFVATLFETIQASGRKTYLETSGTQAKALDTVLPWTDFISMDLKLESATAQPTPWGLHQAFWEQWQNQGPRLKGQLKIVLNPSTDWEELQPLTQKLRWPQLPIILQPETSLETGEPKALDSTRLAQIQGMLLKYFEDVRVIPQVHKWMQWV
jgi:7-carboxy-7-deazaguanine synthase